MSNRMSVGRARRLTDGGVHTVHGGQVIPAARTIVDQADRIARLEMTLFQVEMIVERAIRKGNNVDAHDLAEILELEEDA